MSDEKKSYLLGNFTPKRNPVPRPADAPSATDEFEARSLRRLGGSIAFVSKKGFLWTGPAKGSPPSPC